MIGNVKRKAFSKIKDRVWQKLQTWKEKILSWDNKEILLKVVALSIPTYAMSCFKLTNSFCTKLESQMALFDEVKKVMRGKSIGLDGKSYVNPSFIEVWASSISRPLNWHFL